MDDLLLQPSLRGDARMEALARLIARLSNLPAAIPVVNLFDLVDASALPSLGEQFHVMGLEGWNAAISDTARRDLLKQAIRLHRHKGTPWAVRHALETALSLPTDLREWFSYEGRPFFFRVGVDVTGAVFGPESGTHALELILEYKNVRSWLEYLETRSTHELPVHTGLAGAGRTLVSTRLYFPMPEPVRLPVHTGLAGFNRTRVASRLYFPLPEAAPLSEHTGLAGAGRTMASTRLYFPMPEAVPLPMRSGLPGFSRTRWGTRLVFPTPEPVGTAMRSALAGAGRTRTESRLWHPVPGAVRLSARPAVACFVKTRSRVMAAWPAPHPVPLRGTAVLASQSYTRSSVCPKI